MRTTRASAAALSFFVLALETVVHAQPRPSARPLRDVPAPALALERRSYAWQTVTADLSALTVLGVGIGVGFENGSVGFPIGLVGGVGYLLATPVVHGAHDRYGTGAGSFGMRLASPVVHAFLGIAAFSLIPCEGGCGDFAGLAAVVYGGTTGLLVGTIPPIVLDAVFLARDNPVPASPTQQSSFTLVPTGNYDAKRGETTLGLAGTF